MMVLGIDLDDKVTQISYMDRESMQPVTLSAVNGSEISEIPTVMAKNEKDNAWSFGDEAIELSKTHNAHLITGLFSKALAGAVVYDDPDGDDEEGYDVFDILLLFVKRVLSLSAFVEPWQNAERIVICVEELNEYSIGLLERLAKNLDYPGERIDIISRTESFYEYMLHQKEELWQREVVVFDYSRENMTVRSLSVDRRTRPAVCRINQETGIAGNFKDDDEFLAVCKRFLENRIVTSVYLIGDETPEDTLPQTLRYLCMKRRVFQGGNMYTKGACYGAWDREHESELSRAFLFLGHDRLKSNIGLRMVRNREESYEPLVDAGINWYDVRAVKEFYLGKEREIRILLTPLTGKNEHYAVLRLADFPQRPERCTRVRLEISMTGEDMLHVKVTDLGFGDIFPASGKSVTEEINLHSQI